MRPLITWLAILGYALVALGLPLPLAAVDVAADPVARMILAAKDRSTPFPCMDKPCGCASAEACFRDCCCTTPAERLAWSRRHGLEAEVLAALQARAATPSAPGRSCCASGGCSEPGPVPAEPTAGSCCDTPRDDGDRPAPPTPAPRSRQLTLRAMLACQGALSSWIAVGASLPPPAFPPLPPARSRERIEVSDVAIESSPHAPPAPPPWAR